MSILTIAKITKFNLTVTTMQKSVEKLRAITICSVFTPDSRYDSCIIKLIGDVYCPNTMCSVILCVHKKVFKLSAEATIIVLSASPPVRFAILS